MNISSFEGTVRLNSGSPPSRAGTTGWRYTATEKPDRSRSGDEQDGAAVNRRKLYEAVFLINFRGAEMPHHPGAWRQIIFSRRDSPVIPQDNLGQLRRLFVLFEAGCFYDQDGLWLLEQPVVILIMETARASRARATQLAPAGKPNRKVLSSIVVR